MVVRLATYGSLAPGRVNHGQLAGLNGEWTNGTVRGRLVESGWGAALGHPGLRLDLSGAIVGVDVFASPDLPDCWLRLDAFEGPGYQRVFTQVATADGVVDAWIYVLSELEDNS